MNYKNKTKDGLINELKKLQQEYDSLKTSHERDITGRKLMEERQAFILRSIPLLVYCSETTDIYAATWISENVKHVTGFDRDVFLKEEYFWSSRLHPDDRERVLRTFNELQESKLGAIEYRWQCANGEYHWFLDSFSSFKKTLEGKIEFIGVWLDITDRKQADEALHLEKENFRHSLDDSPLGVRIATIEGNTIYANKTLLNLYGYDTLEELQQTPLKNRYTPESYVQAQKRKHQREHGDFSATEYEISIIRKDGEIRHLQVFRKEILWTGVRQFQVICNDITKRKLAEEMLRESKQKVSNALEFNRRILRTSSIGIMTYKKSGQCVSANVAAAKATGATVEQLLGQNFHEILSWKKSGMYQAAIEALDTGIEQLLDTHFVTTFGKDVWMNFSFSSFDAIGERHLLVFASDITRRKQTEELLKESTERLNEAQKLAHIGIWDWIPDTDTVTWTDELYHIAGLDPTLPAPTYKEHSNLYTPESWELLKTSVEKAMETGESYQLELELIRPNGGTRIVNAFGGTKYDSKGQINGLFGTVQDITERKYTEDALRESEAKFRSIFENSLLGISIASSDGKLLQANTAYAKMYGFESPEKILAEVENVGRLYANPVDRKKVLRILNRNGFMDAKEVEVIRRNGSKFFVFVSASEIRDSKGKLLFNQATHLDLTERRMMLEELRNSKELLEKLYHRLNETRENERAIISREIHDELGQSLTALKLDLNHMYKYVNTNPEAVKQLGSMIKLVSNTIIDVQRISSDLRPGILDDLGLAAAIEWYSEEFEKRTGIRCRLSLDDSILGDSQKDLVFFRVLQEALTNVIRHANASSVRIKLSQFKHGIAMSIHDNGIGILPAKAESGKSLGLIGMRERVRQFGGKIDILSKGGHGTRLTIFIPDK